MAEATESVFNQLCGHQREAAMLASVEALLEWDERTLAPPKAGLYRAEQITLLSGMVHQRRTDPRIGEWLEELADSPLAADPQSDSGATIRRTRRQFDKLVKIPQSLVEELTRTAVLGQQAWVEARKNDDFAAFAPHLEKIVSLKQSQAEAVGYDDSPYDVLLDDYEPDAKTAEVGEVLSDLREALSPLVAAIVDSGKTPKREIVRREFPIADQETFGTMAAKSIGFDFQRGRLDVTHHPFCSEMGPDDCRITTRYDENFFPSAFFGILHEAGHGIYQQGLRTEQFGLPPGTYLSLGIHESQSRMWENAVGRSLSFWRHFFPQAQKTFSASLSGVSLEEFYFAVNDVQPSLIRVEADEATYNLHIIIRFELERALIEGDLAVADLPAAWNEKYQQALGISPPSDADGVLQDIHWSAALIGYFPTYSLGNLYAAQFFDAAEAELGDLGEQFAKGQFEPLRLWLKENIHSPGQCFSASELVQQATGRALEHQPLIDYLRGKLGPLYGLD